MMATRGWPERRPSVGREPQQHSCSPTHEVVVLIDEIEGPLGMCHGAGHIAEDQGLSGTVHRDRARQPTEPLFVHDDHVARWGVRPGGRVILYGVLDNL